MQKKATKSIFPALGTVNTVTVYGDHDPAVLKAARERVLALHRRLSVFIPGNEISRVNQMAGIRPVNVREDTFALLRAATDAANETHGTFDITAGALSRLWREAIKEQRLPSRANIRACRRLCGIHKIVLDENDRSVYLQKRGMRVDLGGIAKGYAAEEVRRILRKNGVEQALINLGGTVIPMGLEMPVGIQNPFASTGSPMGSLTLRNMAVVSSGAYERGFTQNSRRYHHIIDPRTGEPSASGLVGVTLIGADATLLDALATGVFILGKEAGLPILQKHGIHAIFVSEDGEVTVTPSLESRFRLAA